MSELVVPREGAEIVKVWGELVNVDGQPAHYRSAWKMFWREGPFEESEGYIATPEGWQKISDYLGQDAAQARWSLYKWLHHDQPWSGDVVDWEFQGMDFQGWSRVSRKRHPELVPSHARQVVLRGDSRYTALIDDAGRLVAFSVHIENSNNSRSIVIDPVKYPKAVGFWEETRYLETGPFLGPLSV